MKYKTQRKFILDQSGENQVFGMFCCCCLSFQFSFWIWFLFFFFISPYGCLSKPSWVHLHTVRKAKSWTCRQYLLHLSTRVSAQQCRARGMCCPSSCTHHRPEKSSVTHPDVQVHSQNPKLGHTEGPFPLLFTQTIQLLTPSFRNSLSYLLHPHLHVDYSPQAPSQTAERKRPAGFSVSIISMSLTKMGQMPADLKCLFLPMAGGSLVEVEVSVWHPSFWDKRGWLPHEGSHLPEAELIQRSAYGCFFCIEIHMS